MFTVIWYILLTYLLQVSSLSVNETNGEFDTSNLTTPETRLCEDGLVCSTVFVGSTEDVTEVESVSFQSDLPAKMPTVGTDNFTEGFPADTTASTVKDLPNMPPWEDHCDCDMTNNICDINCCCDVDCSSFDKTVFSGCHGSQAASPLYPSHMKTCYPSRFIYRNNVQLLVVDTDEKDIFCIAKDNYPEQLRFTNERVIMTEDHFDRVWNRRKHYLWPQSVTAERPIFDSTKGYKQGEPLWKYTNDSEKITFETIEFPSTLTSSLCEGSTRLIYLVNTQTKCLTASPKTEEECLKVNAGVLDVFTSEVIIVASPLLINATQYDMSPDEAFVTMKMSLCFEDSGCQVITNTVPKPSYDTLSGICSSAIQTIQISVIHNGTFGIIGMQAQIYLTNITDLFFQREFGIHFEWVSQLGNSTDRYERSGNPGYIFGRPLITTVMKGGGVSKGRLSLPIWNPSDWLTLQAEVDTEGICSDKRTNVPFGQNSRTECMMKFSQKELKKCDVLQQKIWKYLVGNTTGGSSMSPLEILQIASYGDPSHQDGNLFEWVPVQYKGAIEGAVEASPCPGLISAVSFRIVYTLVGMASNPQAKIVGAFARGYQSKSSDIECDHNQDCSMGLTSAVVFVDVSTPPEKRFADPPVIRVKLPEDFFYPFLTGGGVSYIVVKASLIFTSMLVVILR